MVETGNKFHDKVSRLISWGHWFTFFNIIIVSLIGLRYIAYSGMADSLIGVMYQFISLIGHFSFLCATVFMLILFPLAFLIPFPRLYRLIAICISTIAITFLIMDTQIFKIYNFHLNPLIWHFLQSPAQVEQIYTINLHYISIPIIFIIELFVSYFVWKKCRKLQAKRIGKPIAVVLFSAFVITHLAYIWADAKQYRPITQQKSTYPLSYPMTARTFLTNQGWLSEGKLHERISRQGNEFKNELRYPITPLTFPATKPADNILLVTVEALRADMLNEQNMPQLYKLSQQGLNFKNHYSGASNRAQGIFSLFYALPNNYWSDITLNYIPPVLLNRLQQQHYRFGLFSSIGFTHPEFLQSSFSSLETEQLKNTSARDGNQKITKQWRHWLNQQNDTNKWFSYLYYKQPDKSFLHNADHVSFTEHTKKLELYQKQVLAIDQQIAQIIKTLKSKAQLDNTIVIITGSHAVSFAKNSSAQSAISDAHVPLVILWPGENAGQISRMTSHLDIVPTLMEKSLGSQSNANLYSSGQSLFDDSERQFLLSGDLNRYVVYEKERITQFSNDGEINSIDWNGNSLDSDKDNLTLLIKVVSQLRRFNY
jgi:membrane-anchored protein YejM (alkaline phosphatase superfamily)